MGPKGQLFTSGTWRVKQGKESEFVETWQTFADWTSQNQPGPGEGVLLQDEGAPERFVSFGPWEDAGSVVDWRTQPQFVEFVARARGLCDEFEPWNMNLVGQSAPK